MLFGQFDILALLLEYQIGIIVHLTLHEENNSFMETSCCLTRCFFRFMKILVILVDFKDFLIIITWKFIENLNPLIPYFFAHLIF